MRADELKSKTKKDLLELARKLDLAGRSAMSKEELVRTILQASSRPRGGKEGPPRGGVRETPSPVGRKTPGEARPPVDPGGAGRRSIPLQDPALKLSRVEEIRRSAPHRPGRSRHPGREGDPGRGERRGAAPAQRGGFGPGPKGHPARDRHPGAGHRDRQDPRGRGPRQGRGDRREHPDPRGGRARQDRRGGADHGRRTGPRELDPRRPGGPRDSISEERAQQAREHLRRTGEARRNSPYTPHHERPREPRPIAPARTAPIPDRFVEPAAPAAQQRQEPRPREGHPPQVPDRYGIDRLVLMVRDPHWIHAYWEVTAATIGEARAKLADRWEGHQWTLRVSSYPGKGAGETGRFDVDLSRETQNWYFRVPRPECDYDAMIGVRLRDGAFYPFARSNRVHTPRDAASDLLDQEWATTDEAFEKIYRLSHGSAAGPAGSGSGSADLVESRADRPQESWSSGMLGSMGSGSLAAPRRRGFWFQVNTELIVYGATEPDARVTVQGIPVPLRPDGTFTKRFQLPDGVQEIPCVAVSVDGASERTIAPTVRRQTKHDQRESESPIETEI